MAKVKGRKRGEMAAGVVAPGGYAGGGVKVRHKHAHRKGRKGHSRY